MALAFDRTFDPAYGTAVEVAPGVRRITANNPGGYTFRGTNTYLVGTGPVVVIDPGPDDAAHLAAIEAAAGGRISHVLVTHTHRDHSPGATPLARRTGAVLAGCAPHAFSRPLREGETTGLDASSDPDFVADVTLGDGEGLDTPAGRFVAIATPGHTANHLSFAIEGEDLLFSGDHVMAWSTSIVAPPDGRMADYMASLDRLAARPETVYHSGHGGPVRDAQAFVEGLKAHRLARESAVLAALQAGDATIPEIVARVYQDTDRSLWAAAGLSVFAQVEWLVEKGAVATEGEALLSGRYRAI